MTAPQPSAPETAPVAPEATAAPTEQNQNDLPQWARDAITKANKEAASYRTQVGELKPLADQFRQLEEASKTEAQRLAEQAANAQRDAEQARADATRYKVAATYGIGADHFDLLGSGDEATVAARAEKIAGLLAAQATAQPPAPPAQPPRRPVEQLRPGATPGQAVDEDEMTWQALGLSS